IDVLAADKANGAPVIDADGVVNPEVAATLQTESYQRFVADLLAEADVDIVLGQLPTSGGDAGAIVPAANGVFHMDAVSPGRPGLPQERFAADAYDRTATFTPFSYEIVVRLSNPYTFRQTAITNVATITIVVGAIALSVAVVVAGAIALRLTRPLRRLTEAS